MLVCVDGSAASDAPSPGEPVKQSGASCLLRWCTLSPRILYSSVVPTLIDASKDAWMVVAGSQGLGYVALLLSPDCFRTRHLRHLRTTSTEHPACPKWGVIGPTIRATLLASELPTTAS